MRFDHVVEGDMLVIGSGIAGGLDGLVDREEPPQDVGRGITGGVQGFAGQVHLPWWAARPRLFLFLKTTRPSG